MPDLKNSLPPAAGPAPDENSGRDGTHGPGAPNVPFALPEAGGQQRHRVREFFVGAGLPVFLLAAAIVYEACLLFIVFAPLESGWLGDFAREFKVWCFSYDPRTGGMEWAAVGMMLMEPLFVVGAAVLLWRRALGGGRWLAAWRSAVAGVTAATLAVASVLTLGPPGGEPELPPFPGERIRTQLVPPAFRLTDQLGRELELGELRGRVVLVTGIYALCSTACPQILIETRKLLDSLPADVRANVSVVALSLNPEYDTTAIMAAVASGYGFTHPEFRYLNGKPEVVHEVLDRMQFARFRDPKTGIIEHANLLMVLDAEGRIAYRFNLNPRHQAWLREAVVSLAAEARAQAAGLADAVMAEE
jgi:protein SCO1